MLAYWFYIDGVDTIVKMAVDYGMSIGFESNDLIVALLIVQFVAFPFTLIWAFVAEKYNDKLVINLSILIYIGVIIFSLTLSSAIEFYILAALVGSVQGGIQASSRSFFALIDFM